MIVSHVGYVQFVIVMVTPCGFSTFFCVSVSMHVTVCDVHVTCTIMRHSLHKSTKIAKRIMPIHSETTACGAKRLTLPFLSLCSNVI